MGVYIDMEKPKICGECPLFIDHCYFDGNEWHNGCFSLEREIFEDELAHDCPLIEIDIVRCGECIHKIQALSTEKGATGCELIRGTFYEDFFCKEGERRTDEHNTKRD